GATLVEKDVAALKVLTENVRRTGLEGANIVRSDVLRFLEQAPPAQFDAVLIDPPYASSLLSPVLARLGQAHSDWLAADGVVVARYFWRDAPDVQIGSLERYRDKRFGESTLSFYRERGT